MIMTINNDKTTMDIGFKIRKQREAKGVTQQQMADFLGMAVSNYNKIENNKIELSVLRMLEISKLLKADVCNLLEIENNHRTGQHISENKGIINGDYATNYFYGEIDQIIKNLQNNVDKLKDVNDKL
ncbi:MAG: helix-turn-helix transcriptional regulator [Balneolaceae bacterium]